MIDDFPHPTHKLRLLELLTRSTDDCNYLVVRNINRDTFENLNIFFARIVEFNIFY